MAGLPTTPRDQRLLAVGIFMLVGSGAYWHFVDVPKQATLVTLTSHIDTLDASNQRARAVLARGTTAKIKQEADSLRATLDLMRTLVPAANEVPALIDQVSNAARRVRLDLAGIEPQPPIAGELFDTYRYKVKMHGGYHEIGAVLSGIASLNRVVSPINLSLQLNTLPNASVTPSRQNLTAVFDIQTYVVRTAPRAATADAAAPQRTVPERSARPDSAALQSSGRQNRVAIYRESFRYLAGGRRDPFISLMSSGALRPIITDLSLVGVIYDAEGKRSVALLVDASTGESFRVRVGQALARMTVTKIGMQDITFSIDEFGLSRSETLIIDRAKKAGAPAPRRP